MLFASYGIPYLFKDCIVFLPRLVFKFRNKKSSVGFPSM
uniref:Uncharacterized protein n=1 Tax=Lotus japonicus TaxID=34305 RepID=I3SIL4_LOTJA|nr:unknown [Lotus japonicus]